MPTKKTELVKCKRCDCNIKVRYPTKPLLTDEAIVSRTQNCPACGTFVIAIKTARGKEIVFS